MGVRIMDNEKEEYREKIIEMVKKIENIDILNYIYIIISDIMIEEGENGNEKDRHEYRRV